MLYKKLIAFVTVILLSVVFLPSVIAASKTPYSPLNDPRPYQGVMDRHFFKSVPQALLDNPIHNARRAYPPLITPGSGDSGVWLKSDGSTQYGVLGIYSGMGGFSITKPSASNSITIYAPTTMGSGNCLETSVITWSPSGTTATYHGLGLYDWCSAGSGGDGTGGWQSFITIDSTWGAKYLAQSNTFTAIDHFGFTVTDKYMYVRIIRTTNNPITSTNCYNAEIWNFTTSAYDFITSSCGVTPNLQAWSFFETFGYVGLASSYCSQLGTWNLTQARSLNKMSSFGGSWTPMTTNEYDHTTINNTIACYNTQSNNWHISSQIDGSGINWQVCGPAGIPTNAACRP